MAVSMEYGSKKVSVAKLRARWRWTKIKIPNNPIRLLGRKHLLGPNKLQTLVYRFIFFTQSLLAVWVYKSQCLSVCLCVSVSLYYPHTSRGWVVLLYARCYIRYIRKDYPLALTINVNKNINFKIAFLWSLSRVNI